MGWSASCGTGQADAWLSPSPPARSKPAATSAVAPLGVWRLSSDHESLLVCEWRPRQTAVTTVEWPRSAAGILDNPTVRTMRPVMMAVVRESTELVGPRGSSRAPCSRWLSMVPAGRAGLVLRGEPGIGKTVLWSRAVEAARGAAP